MQTNVCGGMKEVVSPPFASDTVGSIVVLAPSVLRTELHQMSTWLEDVALTEFLLDDDL